MGERLSTRGADMGETMSKKGDFALIKPYAEMGMYPAEIRGALSIEHEINASPLSIGIVLSKARKMGELRHLTPEEQQDILKDRNSQSKRQALDQRVLRWLFAKAILTVDSKSLPEKSVVLPQGRLGWKDEIKKLEEDGMLEDVISHTKPLILRRVPLTDIVKTYKSQGDPISYQEKSFAFVHKCLEEGLIGEDLSIWHDVHKLYVLHNRSFTRDPSERIRLEVFFVSRSVLTTRDVHKCNELLLRYRKLGEEIGSYWFDNSLASEEDFIANVSNINEARHGEDPSQIYRMGSEGRLRTPIGVDNGRIIFDDSLDQSKRALSRKMTGKEQEETLRTPHLFSSLR